MKNLCLTLILMGIIFQSNGQTAYPSQIQADLMKKSDNQYKAGWILLGSGAALILTAIAVDPNYEDYYSSNDNTASTILAWTGFLSISTSIPVFLSAGRNARTAAKLSIETQALNQPIPFPGQPNRIPSLSLKIPL